MHRVRDRRPWIEPGIAQDDDAGPGLRDLGEREEKGKLLAEERLLSFEAAESAERFPGVPGSSGAGRSHAISP
jgi:hypothetical protein